MRKITDLFLFELVKSMITDVNVTEVVSAHWKYSYVETFAFKEIIKSILNHYELTKELPTIGMLGQQYSTNKDVQEVLTKIKDTHVLDKKTELLRTFETYIKKAQFMALRKKTAELWNGDDEDKALEVLAEESKGIHDFSLVNVSYERIFSGFEKRMAKRINESHQDKRITKIPTGIPQLDYYTRGGVDIGTAILFLSLSGIGKSTILRWLGYSAAWRGYNVVHFQTDSAPGEVNDYYDMMWGKVGYTDMKNANIDKGRLDKMYSAANKFRNYCGEIYTVEFNQFDSATISECRQHLIEISKHMDIHLIIFDYLEKFTTTQSDKYKNDEGGQRIKKEKVAEKICNLASEFNVVAASATQSNSVGVNWDKPEFVITRDNISNLKATVNPFAYCATLNQTLAEADANEMRIFMDKHRHYKISSKNKCFKISSADREFGRFLDYQSTYEKFWDREAKKQRKPIYYETNPKNIKKE